MDPWASQKTAVSRVDIHYLEGKARDMASQEEWVPFADILALLIFGVVLFPNMDGLVDLAAIDAFLFTTIKVKNPMTFCKAFITILTLPICFSTKLVSCLFLQIAHKL